MSALAAAYIEMLAEGIEPARDSVLRKAYDQWVVEQIVRESGIRVYGSQYYLLGSLV